MLRLLPAVLVLLLASAAGAAEWRYEDLGVPGAYFDNGTAQLDFTCRDGELVLGFWVRTPEPQVAGAGAMNLSITPDGGASSSRRTCR